MRLNRWIMVVFLSIPMRYRLRGIRHSVHRRHESLRGPGNGRDGRFVDVLGNNPFHEGKIFDGRKAISSQVRREACQVEKGDDEFTIYNRLRGIFREKAIFYQNSTYLFILQFTDGRPSRGDFGRIEPMRCECLVDLVTDPLAKDLPPDPGEECRPLDPRKLLRLRLDKQ